MARVTSEAGRRGSGVMREVYGEAKYEGSDVPFERATLDHVFAGLWTRDGLTNRDRRLVNIGILGGTGLTGKLPSQFRSALRNGELTAEELREVVLFLAHYAGWPVGSLANEAAEVAISDLGAGS